MPIIDDDGFMRFPIPRSFQARIGWLLRTGLIEPDAVQIEAMPWLEQFVTVSSIFDDFSVSWREDNAEVRDKNGILQVEPLKRSRSIETELLFSSVSPRDPSALKPPARLQFVANGMEEVVNTLRSELGWQSSLPANGEDFHRLLNWELGRVTDALRELNKIHSGGKEDTIRAIFVDVYLMPDGNSIKTDRSINAFIQPNTRYGPEIMISSGYLLAIEEVALLSGLVREGERTVQPYRANPDTFHRHEVAKDHGADSTVLKWLRSNQDLVSVAFCDEKLAFSEQAALAKDIACFPLETVDLHFASALRFFAIVFVASHEEGHLRHGHIALFPTEVESIDEESGFVPAALRKRKPLNWLFFSQLMELQADAYAIRRSTRIVRTSIIDCQISDEGKVHGNLLAQLVLALKAAALTFLPVECKRAVTGDRPKKVETGTHPETEFRIMSLLVQAIGGSGSKWCCDLQVNEKAAYADLEPKQFGVVCLTVLKWWDEMRLKLGLIDENAQRSFEELAMIGADLAAICASDDSNEIEMFASLITEEGRSFIQYVAVLREELSVPLTLVNLTSATGTILGKIVGDQLETTPPADQFSLGNDALGMVAQKVEAASFA